MSRSKAANARSVTRTPGSPRNAAAIRRSPSLGLDQIREQLGRAIDRVMGEGSLYDPDLAALAIKQAQGDLIEAAFLLRAYRTTLPRFAHARPVDTAAMRAARRISAIFKDLPGGQTLGPTYDYTHRLLDFELAESHPPPDAPRAAPDPPPCRAFPTFWAAKDCWKRMDRRTPSPAT